jgi:formate dehydrogenase gamma subunit
MTAQQTEQKQVVRFSRSQRYEHFVLIVTVIGLALTGLPQKYAAQDWARTLINILGGIESARIIHRFLATLLIVEAIYHGLVISYKLFVRGFSASMWPGKQDWRDLREWVAYNLGRKTEPPSLPRYHFGQKAMYLGAVIGILILIVTGFMLWNPIAATKILPGGAIPAARVIHGDQALLAVLVVVTWHLYSNHIRRFNPSMFTGKLSRKVMLEEHAGELAAIESGVTQAEFPPEKVARRRGRFWPVAVVVTIVLVVGLRWFVTFEDTAITTIPRQEAVVYAPQAMPAQGDARVGAAIWSTMRCAFCHGEQAGGGAYAGAPSLRGTTLPFEKFLEQVRNGGGDMPAFGSGDIPDAYVLHLWTWLKEQSG